MQRHGFEEYAAKASQRDGRFETDGYFFLRDVLDFTVKKERKDGSEKHVRGPELLEGFREFALKEFGPMAITVLEAWGIRKCEDVGAMVFNLVEVGAFGRTKDDSPDDFAHGYDFNEAFSKPYLPNPNNIAEGMLSVYGGGIPARAKPRKVIKNSN